MGMRRLAPVENSNLASACKRLVLSGPFKQYRLVAHIGPGPGTKSWSLLPALLSTVGMEAILLLPAAAVEAGMSDEAVGEAWNACLAAATASQSTMEEFLAVGGFPL